ncbi:MAG: YggS family pyridoxal phosphate-dependent enzyme [Bacteroidaceae bacterium]
MNIADNLKKINQELPDNVKLVAVSKFHPVEAVKEAYDQGQRIFGENHVQEMSAKQELLPKDIQWHFIGHLQKNKIKYMISYVSMIHSIDSFDLMKEVNKQAAKVGRTVNCLLQIHIASEETKFGFSIDECRKLLADGEWKEMKNVNICGLMGMATNTDNTDQVKKEFTSLSDLFKEAKDSWFANSVDFKELSMGMSQDYPIAIAAGSTMIRVGTRIFGNRIYK